MDDGVEMVDIPPKTAGWDERRRARPKVRGIEEKRRHREVRERRHDREDRAPRRDYTSEKRSQERLRIGDRRETERDHKRRKSASPPDTTWDRRHSPPLRKSPLYKRRRDVISDGGLGKCLVDEDGKGFVNDSRFGGLDGTGSYLSRRMERQSGCGCEKLQGCSGFSIRAYSTESYSGSPNSRKDGLLSYKQFIVGLEDDIVPKEAQCRYESYKTEYIITQKQAFFKQHKDDDWLREKYDPARLEAVLVRRNENAKILAKELLSELQADSLDLGPGVRPSTKQAFEDDADIGPANKRSAARSHARAQEWNAAPKAPLQCSDPERVKKDIQLKRTLIKKLDAEKGIEGNILLADQNSEHDIAEGVPVVVVRSWNQVKALEGDELLDVMLTYLWRVHFVDYYGMVEYKEQPKRLRHIRVLDEKSVEDAQSNMKETLFADWVKKLESTWQARLQTGDLIESMLGNEKLKTTAGNALDPFVRKIRDEKYGWKYGCGAKGCTKLFHGPEFVHKHLKLKHSDLVTDAVTKAREELYFQNYMSDVDAPGANQTVSLRLRQSAGDKSRKGRRPRTSWPSEEAVRNQTSEDKQPPNMELHRPRDFKLGSHSIKTVQDCTRVREEEEQLEIGGREEESRFDTRASEHSPPPHAFPILRGVRPPLYDGRPPLRGRFERFPMEPLMFDSFNGPPLQGLPGGLFVGDIPGPPQVLMPVPGAGPLGPFVPAHPGMGMGFLIEDPGSFHGGFDQGYMEDGNGRGRRSRTQGPMVGGGLLDIPSMMVPHVMHHDPRGIRSYDDLDMPGEEVTVIDYRTI